MSATAIPKLKLKKQYVVSEPQSTEELREHLKRHVEQEYELVKCCRMERLSLSSSVRKYRSPLCEWWEPMLATEGIICPNCGRLHQNVSGKCPNPECRPTRAVKSRDLAIAQRLCVHDTPLHWPCERCERSKEDCKPYRQDILVRFQSIYITDGVSRSKAWEQAEQLLAAVDLALTQNRKGTRS